METQMQLELQMPHAGTLTPTAFDINPNLSHADWVRAGEILMQAKGTVAWWIGDWWKNGTHGHGARKEMCSAPDWRGPTYESCANAASVCKAFENSSRRRELLNFSMHAEVAKVKLSHAQQDALLDRAEREHAKVLTVRAWVKELMGGTPAAGPTREELTAHFEVTITKPRTMRRAILVIDRAPDLAAEVMRGKLRLAAAERMARARQEELRAKALEVQRAHSAQRKQQRDNVIVLGDDPHFIANQLCNTLRTLAELSTKHIAIYVLRHELIAQDRAFIDNNIRAIRLYLQRVEATCAAKLGDINIGGNA
jgi:hypothetical protein